MFAWNGHRLHLLWPQTGLNCLSYFDKIVKFITGLRLSWVWSWNLHFLDPSLGAGGSCAWWSVQSRGWWCRRGSRRGPGKKKFLLTSWRVKRGNILGWPLVQKLPGHLQRFSSIGWSCLRSGEYILCYWHSAHSAMLSRYFLINKKVIYRRGLQTTNLFCDLVWALCQAFKDYSRDIMVDVVELLEQMRERLNVVLVDHPVDAMDLQERQERIFLGLAPAPAPRSHCELPGRLPVWWAEEKIRS